MPLPRRLAMRSPEQLHHLTKTRLLAYRRKALSLENSPPDSDYTAEEIGSLDDRFIWFKSAPRWELQYSRILQALASIESAERDEQ